MDSFGKTVNIRFEDDELFILGLLVVEQLELAFESDPVQVSELKRAFAQFAAEFFPVVGVDAALQFLRDALRIQPAPEAVEVDELHAACADAGGYQRVLVVVLLVQTDAAGLPRLQPHHLSVVPQPLLLPSLAAPERNDWLIVPLLLLSVLQGHVTQVQH